MNNQVNISAKKTILQRSTTLRNAWVILAVIVTGLIMLAIPYRYQMMVGDVYGYEAGLIELGISPHFFAIYFIFWELLLAAGSLLVAAIIVWRKSDDPFAMLVAFLLVLLGLVPPLLDGLMNIHLIWYWLLIILRVMAFTCFMVVFCLFPNGKFLPKWTKWLVAGWFISIVAVFIIAPDLFANTAVLPNTRTLSDALLSLISAMWFAAAFAVQIYRYFKVSSPEEKQQSKWVLMGFLILLIVSGLSILLLVSVPYFRDDAQGRVLYVMSMGVVLLLAALCIPVSIALAILRYRLWEIDIFLNRTMVYGGLTILITATYIFFVGMLGSLAAIQSGFVLAIVIATGIVSIGFHPFRHRLQTAADHIFPVSNLPSVEQIRQESPSKNAELPDKASSTESRTLRLSRLFWYFNTGLGFMLFSIGLIIQSRQGLWQLPDLSAFDAVPMLASIPNQTDLSGLYPLLLAISYLQAAVFVSVGIFIFRKKSDDVMGIIASWLLIAIGLGFTPNVVYLPILVPAWHVPVTLFQIGLFGSAFLFLSLFPNGRTYPPLARPAFIIWLGYLLTWLIFPQLNLHRAATIWPAFLFASVVMLGITFQIIRFRKLSTGEEKQQTKWVVIGFAFANFGLLGIALLLSLNQGNWSPLFMGLMLILGFLPILIPVTMGFALMRYRLWNVDIIINRTLVYGGLSFGIILVYMLVVGVLGSLAQTQGGFWFALLATGLIAVLFQPVRQRLQRATNRLMFGERDDPYAVLTTLGAQIQQTATPEETLQVVVETIASTLKLPFTAIELAGEEGRMEGAKTGRPLAALTELPLLYQNETVGYLVVSPRSPNESFSEREIRLLSDLAAQTGAMAYSVRLTAALQRSREKLVLTREEERRRIRHDLHDELGPTLASQTFIIDTILEHVEPDPQEAVRLLRKLKNQNQDTVAQIRRLVYELRPPALDELGLLGALRAHVGKLDLAQAPRVRINADPDPLPVLPAAVEAAAYRISLEGITNSIRHAKARNCDVMISIRKNSRQELHIEITDDGIGLSSQYLPGVGLTSMRERAEELGGLLTVQNLPKGLKVSSQIPLMPLM